MRLQKNYVILTCAAVLLLGGVLVVEGCVNNKSTTELISDLKSDQEKDRMTAVRTLPVNSEEADRVIPALIEALKDTQSDIRLSAAIKLGNYGEKAKEAIPPLKIALKDRDARVRTAAAKALAKIDPNSAPKNSSD